MKRRDAGLALLLAPLVLGAPARAQEAGRVYRLGYMSQPSRESVEAVLQVFLKKLRELGWIEGKNLVIEYRWADGKTARLPELAAELVRLKVDLIVAPSGPAALAAKNATGTIPIVMIFPADPVQLGLVASLSRPGGNVSGTSYSPGPEIFGKQLQILKEAVPHASRIAVLRNPSDEGWDVQNRALENAARSMGVRLQQVVAKGPEELDSVFAAMTREQAQALLVGGSSTFIVHRAKLAELALKTRLPTMMSYREFVEAGCLMAYAVNMIEFIPRAAVYVDKIFRGANPADLPVEQPTKFELVINLKTAKALGLTIPEPLLLQAETIG